MSARWLLNLLLLLAVVLAAAVLFFKPHTAAQASYRLTPDSPDQWSEITIERGANVRMRLARSESQWQMREPVTARLEETALTRLLDLTRLEIANRLPATGLERYELDKPWARIHFGQHAVDFGMTNAVTQELYVRAGEYVYAIPARFAAAVPSGAAKLLAHRMFAPYEAPVAFRLARFSVQHDGTRWRLDPADPNLSQDDLVRWVDQWRLASSVLTQPAQPSSTEQTITVLLKTGRELSFAVVGRAPDLVLRRKDEGLDYRFSTGMASLLLEKPGTAPPVQR